MLETLAAFNSIEMLGGFAFEPPIGPVGYNRVRERRPARTRDGWMTMLPYTGDQWQAFFEATGHPEWVEELGVLDPVQRSSNIDQLYARLRDLTPTRTTAEWGTLLLELDIPFADFATLSRISEQEHLSAVGLFQQLDHPTEGTIVQPRPPMRFSASPAEIHRFPPRLGEHSREILAEVGFAEHEIETLLTNGAVLQADEPGVAVKEDGR